MIALALMVAGVAFILLGWVGVSGEVYIANQVPYAVSGGIGGLGFLIVAATLWLSADMNDEWHQLDRLDAQQSELQRSQEALDVRLAALEEQRRAGLSGTAASIRRGAKRIEVS